MYDKQLGNNEVATYHYSVATIKLSRKLPNIFFDSQIVRKKQFRFHFGQSQIIRLEGNFDQYFSTYVPEGYQVDSLSFITPDVMLALIEAKEYDIEIIDDRLYLYSTIKNPEIQMEDMRAKIHEISSQLSSNIQTYRDDRLSYAEGRKTVSLTGARLSRNKILQIIATILITLIMLLLIYTVRA